MSERHVDIFGESCVVLSRCERCDAPRYQRAGETGSTLLHAPGCTLGRQSRDYDQGGGVFVR